MVFITADTFAENCIYTITLRKKDKTIVLSIGIKDLAKKLNIKNILDSIDKEVQSKFEDNCLMKEKLENIKGKVQNLIKI